MAQDNVLQAQRDFSAGQIDPEALRRDNLEIVRAGGRTTKNCYLLAAGGFGRRPGISKWVDWTGRIDTVSPASGISYDICFGTGTFQARKVGDTPEQIITGCPWTAAMIPDLSWVLYDYSLIVCHKTMQPRVLDWDSTTGNWTLRLFQFRTGNDLLSRQPFYRFAAGGITLQPSAISGSITVTASSPVFSALHVGVAFRWFNRRFQVTAYTSPTVVTATCLEQLPISQQIALPVTTDVAGFRAGDILTMVNSPTVTGLCTRTGGTTINLWVINTGIQSGFFDAGAAGVNDIVGPNAKSDTTAVATVSPEAGTIWEEAFMSTYRGWPGHVSTDRQRLIFCDFAQQANAILWSSIGDFEDFNIGASPSDGIFELIPKFERVQHVIGGPDEIVLTEKSVFYIPISATNPLSPGTTEFIFVGSVGSGTVRPVLSKNSTVYVSEDGKRIMACVHVGGYSKPYELQYVSRFHSNIITLPTKLAIASGTDSAPGEDVYVLNSDGTLVVGRQEDGATWAGFFPWSLDNGYFKDVCALGGKVLVRMDRANGASTISNVGIFDSTVALDNAISVLDALGSQGLGLDGSALYLALDDGVSRLILDGATLTSFEGLTMSVQLNNRPYYKGVATSGKIFGAPAVQGNFVTGFGSTLEFSPVIWNADSGPSRQQRLHRRKVNDVAISVLNSGAFMLERKNFGGLRWSDDPTQPPPLRSATYRTTVLGRSYDPKISLIQSEPEQINVTEFALEATT